ncbi:MAG: tetratricopeptide repeat-containing sulfotransferase family protein [Caulobacteraceae bacterium]
MLRRGMALLATDPPAAEAAAREVLGKSGANVDGLIVLGTSLRLQGRFGEAIGTLLAAENVTAESWIVQYELGRALLAAGRSREAVPRLSRAVERNGELAPAWRMLGDIHLVAGSLSQAQRAYDMALSAALSDPRLKNAMRRLAAGQIEEAARAARTALLAGDGEILPAKGALGEVLLRQGKLAEAVETFKACASAAPQSRWFSESLALALFAAGDCEEALAQIGRAIASTSLENFRSLMVKSAVLAELGDHEEASGISRPVLERFPDQPRAWLVQGNALRTLGQTKEAIDAYRRALELDPDFAEASWSLANLKTFRFSPAERGEMETKLARPNLAPEERSLLHFALGKVLEDAADYEGAFGHYVEGGRIERAKGAWDGGSFDEFLARSKALFSPDFFAARAGWGAHEADPIFIVGLPRSGSSLVEQILASHASIEGAGELAEIQTLADWIGIRTGADGQSGYPEGTSQLPWEGAGDLGRRYLEWAAPRRRSGKPRFTDKAPWNFLHIGLIRLILPEAKIVDVRRHPLDCCVSIFRQRFKEGWEFSYDLADLGRYYRGYVDFMAHFEAALPGFVHRLSYERLVRNPEEEIRSLLGFVGVRFDPACLKFFDNPRAVATPSSEQVRRPISTEGLDQWRRFEPWLSPLKAALGPALEGWLAEPP